MRAGLSVALFHPVAMQTSAISGASDSQNTVIGCLEKLVYATPISVRISTRLNGSSLSQKPGCHSLCLMPEGRLAGALAPFGPVSVMLPLQLPENCFVISSISGLVSLLSRKSEKSLSTSCSHDVLSFTFF